jgi:hypothetical protein
MKFLIYLVGMEKVGYLVDVQHFNVYFNTIIRII